MNFTSTSSSYNPTPAVTDMVWALPLSLATTYGIIVIFSSSGYLDVSVPRVRSYLIQISDMSSTYQVAPFGNHGLSGYLLLNHAYRSLSRPSSPLRAKASPVRP